MIYNYKSRQLNIPDDFYEQYKTWVSELHDYTIDYYKSSVPNPDALSDEAFETLILGWM